MEKVLPEPHAQGCVSIHQADGPGVRLSEDRLG